MPLLPELELLLRGRALLCVPAAKANRLRVSVVNPPRYTFTNLPPACTRNRSPRHVT